MNTPDDLLAEFEALLQRAQSADPDVISEMRARFDEMVADRKVEPAGLPEEGWHGLIGECSVMLELRRFIEKFAKASAPVLITGESGTGKERVAHAVHQISSRSNQAFVVENCAAIPATLLESVLFGHKRGAFTGAVADHPGHFVSAHRGTIFLDEIGEMSLSMQVKLLRTLQEGEVRAVGDNKVRKVDVRLVAASHRDLAAMVQAGEFREDLLYRLNVITLEVPALRDRPGDVDLLADFYLRKISSDDSTALATLTPAARAALNAYAWPGNVRELENEIRRATALLSGSIINVSDLSPTLQV